MRTSWLLVLILLGPIKVTTQSISNNSKCELSKEFDCGAECIPKPWKCDNVKDCENGADEIDCEPNKCKEEELLCKNGECSPNGYKCDLHEDCRDESDEKYCGHISYSLSENSSFNFEDLNHYKYDGGYDKNGCLPGFGLCGIQQLCIPNRSFCDGKQDCEDDADEKNCPPWNPVEDDFYLKSLRNPCKNKFVCQSEWLQCINEEELCNGKKDCPMGEDESEKCSECSTEHCEHRCRDTPNGAQCVCDKGYQLHSNGFSCVDLDECTLPKRACDHFCQNQIGSFRCSCAKGYQLKADGKTCELTNTSEGFLLIEYYEEIRSRLLEDFTATNFTSIYKLRRGESLRSFDYFRRDDKFVISILENEFGKDKLVMVKNGSSRVFRENALVEKHNYLAVDWIGNNLFFQEEQVDVVGGKNVSRNFIAVCTMDGRFYRRLIEIEEGHDVNHFAIHPMRGLLFWLDSPQNRTTSDPNILLPYRIMMANMDGSQIQALVVHRYLLSFCFTIDYVNHDIYYEHEDNRIRRVNIDTKKTEVIASNLYFWSVSMAYHNGFLYLINMYQELRILEVARKNARVHRILESGSVPFYSIRMVFNDSLHQLEPSTVNPCAELDCPWICVIVPDFTAKCLCPDGYILSGTTCIPPLTVTGEHDNLIGLELMSEYCKTGVGCLNGGSCREVSNKIVCDCLEPYDGLYCERRKPLPSDEDVTFSSMGTASSVKMENAIDLKIVKTQSTSPNTTCDLSKEFDCGTECIPKPWKCDNIKDCQNGADEIDCEPNSCKEGEMLCNNGVCVPGTVKCDGHKDCYDESDEKFCGHISYSLKENYRFFYGDPNHYKYDGGYDVKTQSTSPNTTCDLSKEFDCGTECIPKPWKCDNIKDCQNGADEIDCEPNSCKEGEMLCNNGVCVPGTVKCDGHKDCYDESDEKFCGHISYSLKENYRFFYGDPNHYKYDGGYDENGCLPGFGLCGTPQVCIPNRSFCDGIQDCSYYSDENHCTPGGPGGKNDWFSRTENPCKNMFACKKNHWRDQKCINETEVCNGKQDCPLGEDESKKCSECSSTHCEHKCKNTPTGAKCECKKGYQLDSDGFSCVDLDECTLPERACHHFCENTIGSFRCSCARGYQFKADGKTCELTNPSEGFLLFSVSHEIKKRPLQDFTETNFSITYKNWTAGGILAFDYSRRDNKFFISYEERKVGTKLIMEQNGKSRVLRENGGIEKIYSHLVVDWIGGNLFFQESVGGLIGENNTRSFIAICTMDGRFYRRLFEVNENVQGFAIHPMRGLLFWHEGSTRIMMANMDGSEVQPLVESKYPLTYMFAIDHVNHDIYYESRDNEREHKIRRVNIDTRKTEVIASNYETHSMSMAYHNGFIFWFDLRGGLRVLEVARKGARAHRVLKNQHWRAPLSSMVVNDSLHQVEPSAGNPCKELDCPWICVIVPGFTAKCLCPDGYTSSILDTTCIPSLIETGEQDNLIGLELMSDYCKAGQGCLNGGSCREVYNKTRLVCDCLEPYDGLYCERRKPVLSDEAILIFILVILVLLLIAIGYDVTEIVYLAHKYQPKFAPCKKGVMKAFDQPHFVVDPDGTNFTREFQCCSTCETLKIEFGPRKLPAKMCCMPELIVTDHYLNPTVIKKVVPPDMDEMQYREVNGHKNPHVSTGAIAWLPVAAGITQTIIMAMVIFVWHATKERIALECVPDCDYEYEKEIKVFNPSKSAMMSENMNSDLMSVGAI
ncbi:unnamed protein product [Caenorhabditis brenneri]